MRFKQNVESFYVPYFHPITLQHQIKAFNINR